MDRRLFLNQSTRVALTAALLPAVACHIYAPTNLLTDARGWNCGGGQKRTGSRTGPIISSCTS